MDRSQKLWSELDLVAVDLEGTGAQDRDNEAILELAIVPISAGIPHPDSAYFTLNNPHRPVPRRPWISPGLTDDVLSHAPSVEDVEPHVLELINGRHFVGHNVLVDWRLLRRCMPSIEAAGLIDTLKLLRRLGTTKRGLAQAIEELGLTTTVNNAVPASQPHRALWDATATAFLLTSLAGRSAFTATDLLAIGGVAPKSPEAQGILF